MGRVDTRLLWIPSALLRTFNQVEPEIRLALEEVVAEILLPDDQHRTTVLHSIYTDFDASDRERFTAFLRWRRTGSVDLDRYLTEEDEAKCASLLTSLCAPFQSHGTHLTGGAARILDGVSHLTKFKKEWKTVLAGGDKSAQEKILKEAGKHRDLAVQLIRHVAPVVVSRESVSEMFVLLKKALNEPETLSALQADYLTSLTQLMEHVAAIRPAFFQSSMAEIAMMLEEDEDELDVVALRLLSCVSESIPAQSKSMLKRLDPILSAMVFTDKQANSKHAIIALTNLFPKTALKPITERLVVRLKLNRSLPATLRALAHISSRSPALYSEYSERVFKFVVDLTASKDVEMFDGQSLLSVSICEGMKLLVHQFKGLNQDCERVLAFLSSIIDKSDDVSQVSRAAISILKLSRNTASTLTPAHFILLASVLNHQSATVRHALLSKVSTYLFKMQIPNKYICLLAIGCHDADPDVRNRCRSSLEGNVNQRRHVAQRLQATALSNGTIDDINLSTILPEYTLPHLIHLLAHTSCISDGPLYPNTTRVLSTFLVALSSKGADSFSFVLLMLEYIKLSKDKLHPTSNRIQVVCDLCVLLVRSMSESKAWHLQAHPGKIYLPTSLYEMPEKTDRSEINKSYLPPGFKLAVQTPVPLSASKRVPPQSSPSPHKKSILFPSRSPAKQSDSDSEAPVKRKKKATPKPRKTAPVKRTIQYDSDVDEEQQSPVKKKKTVSKPRKKKMTNLKDIEPVLARSTHRKEPKLKRSFK